MLPIVGNHSVMTLRDYIKTGNASTHSLAVELGVSIGAVHKWASGQREPDLAMALRIVAATKGKVKVQDLIKPRAAA